MTKTCDQGSDNRIAVNSYQHRTNYYWKNQAKLTMMEQQGNQQFDLAITNHQIATKERLKCTNHISSLYSQQHHCLSDRRPIMYHQLTRYNSLWLWRWLSHRLSNCKSLTTTVLFRTTLTWTTIYHLLIKYKLLGSQ